MSAAPCCKLSVETRSAGETYKLGELIGKNISRACIIGLCGDLGAGKTLFIKGLARGLEVPDQFAVTSPTYTLINEYPGRLTLFHVDLYRIGDPEEIDETGLYEILSADRVVAIEWAGRLPEDAPQPDIIMQIEGEDADTRRFTMFFYGPGTSHLVETIKNQG
ncbi:MAG: tRNA (adenosine(37)-N6)-threonylcarbamoyltransferase complex ATPase subunit type 1 TsaE [Desulfobacteraceae bacterium]|nr:tRNA (adenosine(37)-N6)-threonylcarbamoyltransferase complex ATPase subunit type 1 TsaE [Desulfobacteraceae bacterium]